MFFQLTLYRARNGGSCDVPKGYCVEVGGEERASADGGCPGSSGQNRRKVKLGNWVQEMRRHRRVVVKNEKRKVAVDDQSSTQQSNVEPAVLAATAKLTPERIEALDSLNFTWENVKSNPRAFRHDLWVERYNMLVEYHAEHGHCNPPNEERLLHRWCNTQRDLNAEVSGTKVDMGPTARKCAGWAEELSADRKKRIEGKQSSDYKEVWRARKAKLDELNFVWRKRDRVSWEDRLEELKQYKAEFGDCQVPQHYVLNRKLGKWVNRVRTEYKHFRNGTKSAMTVERIALLGALDFEWTNSTKGRPSVPYET